MYHYGDMSLSIVQTGAWQSFDTPAIIFYEASDLSDIFWQTRRRWRWTMLGFSATPGVDFRVVDREKQEIARKLYRANPESGGNFIVAAAKMYETNSRYAYYPRFAFWSMPSGVSISEEAPGTIGRWAAFVAVSRPDLEIDRVLACPRTTESGAWPFIAHFSRPYD